MGVVAGDGAEEDRGVLDRAREGADLVEAGGEGDQAVAGDAAVGRFEPDDAAEAGRLADGAAGVRAEPQDRLAGPDGRGRSAGGAARHPAGVPGVARGEEGGV